MTFHSLKTWEESFESMWTGEKTAEFRKDDRGYANGDVLLLHEWAPETSGYTGRLIIAKVTHVLRGPNFGVPSGYAMLSLSLSNSLDFRADKPW